MKLGASMDNQHFIEDSLKGLIPYLILLQTISNMEIFNGDKNKKIASN